MSGGSDNTVAASSVHDMGSVCSSHAVMLSSADVMPENGTRMFGKTNRTAYESRISQYRRKRKRERKRKMFALLISTIAMIVAAVSYCAVYRPEILESVQKTVESNIGSLMKKSTAERSLTDKIVERNASSRQMNAKIVNPFHFSFEQDVMAVGIDPVDGVKACDPREAAALAAAESERRRLEELEKKELMRRPWACNIPFAYLVHTRCNLLAKQSPLFDLQELILSMFQ